MSSRQAETPADPAVRVPTDPSGRWHRSPGRSAAALHGRMRAWLAAELDEPWDGPTVVVTHHAPSLRSMPEAERDSPHSPAYCSDLRSMIESAEPDLWVHGHVHRSADYHIGRTSVICNPCGYPDEEAVSRFDGGMVVEV